MIKFHRAWLKEYGKGYWYVQLSSDLSISLTWRRAALLIVQVILMLPLFLVFTVLTLATRGPFLNRLLRDPNDRSS